MLIFCLSYFITTVKIPFYFEQGNEDDEDYAGDGDGNGVFDDADEIGNNGDNNGEPMEES